MKKRIVLLLVLVNFGIGIAARSISFAEKTEKQEQKKQKEDDIYKELELFSDAVSVIRVDYVEEKKSKDLIYGALKGIDRKSVV